MSAAAKKFLDFSNSSPSHFHCVATIKAALLASGYKELNENISWEITKGGKYFYTRNQSTIAAFAVGKNYKPGNGFALVGAHTDSPNFVIKPVSAVKKEGYLQVGVQTYGGGLWHTWFDRDLTIAGRVIVKEDETFASKLVHVKRSVLRIPSLCIHLGRDQNDKLMINKETHLTPVMATEIQDQLAGNNKDSKEDHHPALVNLLAKELNAKAEDIQTFELSVCDTQPAAIGGVHSEFVFAPRLDNQLSCFMGLEALLASSDDNAADHVRVLVCFDNEEVGSTSAHGAASPIVSELVSRVSRGLAGDEDRAEVEQRAIRLSYMISADMAHAVHPNYASKHEDRHKPSITGGPVIKYNANQRYATTSVTAFVLKELAKRNNIPLQEFVVRNDSACGSTIGPIMSANTGIRTVDIGNPQLAMHSVREMCGVTAIQHGIDLFQSFYSNYHSVNDSVKDMN
mmetsp:Transcript_20259/g.34596  ORF Transcript_20259/g.34596 Transcript_20259/m.34596 type:complete len:456 (-) Transcript_20259:32-1399(-)